MAATTTAPPNTARRHHVAFPGKPLAQLGDKPLWHVHQRCLEAERLDGVVVATDDERIERVCHELGIECMRTDQHLTGTGRVAECAARLPADAYINVQGDEPFISPAAIDAVSEALEHLVPRGERVHGVGRRRDALGIGQHVRLAALIATIDRVRHGQRSPVTVCVASQ
ncbi:NTP transferase domain-containing protein [Streptomyces sp. NPDC026092]|uniref:cytidylyltransferase domain-containing protein n=1 Tax=Streptomyces sp. NPDC026092 TaxID=3154797 RepID=UPI0033E94757